MQAKDLVREVVGVLQPQVGRPQGLRGHAGEGRLPDQQSQHPKVDRQQGIKSLGRQNFVIWQKEKRANLRTQRVPLELSYGLSTLQL